MGKRIGSALELAQIATPGTPASGSTAVYVKSDGYLYTQSSGGSESKIWGAIEQTVPFSYTGTLATLVGTSRLPITGGTYTITSVAAMVGSAPSGSAVILDVNKNGTTIYGTQANRPTIAAGGTSATVGSASVTSVTTGDYLTIDVDQVGSSSPGTNLTVVIGLLKTA